MPGEGGAPTSTGAELGIPRCREQGFGRSAGFSRAGAAQSVVKQWEAQNAAEVEKGAHFRLWFATAAHLQQQLREEEEEEEG